MLRGSIYRVELQGSCECLLHEINPNGAFN